METNIKDLLIDKDTLEKENRKLKAEIRDNKNVIKQIDKELKDLAFKK